MAERPQLLRRSPGQGRPGRVSGHGKNKCMSAEGYAVVRSEFISGWAFPLISSLWRPPCAFTSSRRRVSRLTPELSALTMMNQVGYDSSQQLVLALREESVKRVLGHACRPLRYARQKQA